MRSSKKVSLAQNATSLYAEGNGALKNEDSGALPGSY